MRQPFIVAEISGDHLGSLDRAIKLVQAAAKAGADAVKFQTFTPEQMVDAGVMITSGPWAGREALELYRETYTPREWHPELFACARECGIEAFSSVFHPDDVDFLETLNCPRYKIASFELTDLNLIWHAAKTGKPLILSTGMASEHEIWRATTATAASGAASCTLLKCTSAYPATAQNANLATIFVMKETWPKCRIGLSDHTQGIGVAVAAAFMGASMIEKHLTLSRADGGLDAAFSMEPDEFAQMVTECRRAVEALGEVRYGPLPAEAEYVKLRRPPGGKRGG